jgi:hypothetical protein
MEEELTSYKCRDLITTGKRTREYIDWHRIQNNCVPPLKNRECECVYARVFGIRVAATFMPCQVLK